MITYNHEKYIEQAVHSVMSQQLDVDYELVIGDDFSTDNTRETILRLQQRYPDRIKYIFHPENVGLTENFIATYQACKGKYIAILEGDDYWIDSYKLKKQMEFLNAHPDYVLVGANAVVYQQETQNIQGLISSSATAFDFDTRYIIKRNPLPTLTAMFRNNLIKDFPPMFYQSTGCDRSTWLLLSLQGKCRVEPDIVGVYRRHHASVTHQRISYEDKMRAFMEHIENAYRWNIYLQSNYSKEVYQVLLTNAVRIFFLSIEHRRLIAALQFSAYIKTDLVSGYKRKLLIKVFKNIRKFLMPILNKFHITHQQKLDEIYNQIIDSMPLRSI